MKREALQTIQEANAYINGKGYLGLVKKLKIPTLEWEMIEAKGALSTNYNAGILKATEFEFTISKMDKNEYLSFGLNSFAARVPFLFKASIHQSGKLKKVPFSMAITGDIISMDTSDFESGKEAEVTFKVAAHFVDINIDGVPMLLKDSENMICLIGGVDYMAGVRANLAE